MLLIEGGIRTVEARLQQQPEGYGAYRRIQTETSSPGELVMMLYNTLVNDLEHAERALRDDDGERAHAALTRAQDIVMELFASLDMDSGELAQQLSALYHYVYERLIDANLRKDAVAVREAATVVEPLREAWAQAVSEAQRDAAVARAGRG